MATRNVKKMATGGTGTKGKSVAPAPIVSASPAASPAAPAANPGVTTDAAGNRLFVSRPTPAAAPAAAPAVAARVRSRKELRQEMRDKMRAIQRTPGSKDASRQRHAIHQEYQPQIRGAAFKAGGSVSSASKRADGCAVRGKTRA